MFTYDRKKITIFSFSTTQLLVTLQLFNTDSLLFNDCVFVCRWVIFIFHLHQYTRCQTWTAKRNVI